VNCPKHIQPGIIDVTTLPRESLTKLLSQISGASEIAITLSYQSGTTQLREAVIEVGTQAKCSFTNPKTYTNSIGFRYKSYIKNGKRKIYIGIYRNPIDPI
jgi:hypothetical protein